MEDIAPLAIPVLFVTFIIAEVVRPARKLPKVSWWQLKGVLFFVMTGVIASILPFAWAGFVDKHALLHLSGLGSLAGAAVGYVVFQFFSYWWHRLQHATSQRYGPAYYRRAHLASRGIVVAG